MASTTSYKSNINLQLSRVPIDVQDSLVYDDLQSVHNAIEILSLYADDTESSLSEYVAKRRGAVLVDDNYSIAASDPSTIIVSTVTNPSVLITMPPVSESEGYRFEIKHAIGEGVVTVRGEGTSTIDDDEYELDLYDSISVKCIAGKWYVY